MTCINIKVLKDIDNSNDYLQNVVEFAIFKYSQIVAEYPLEKLYDEALITVGDLKTIL